MERYTPALAPIDVSDQGTPHGFDNGFQEKQKSKLNKNIKHIVEININECKLSI